uniref:Nuclear pore complex protein NUP58 n=1 Tax=Chenopodium quinoa TaxID=63459 RepID=A0A803KSG7_CHEQI
MFSQELGGISTSMERQKVTLHELMGGVKEMLRNAEIAIRSFMILQPRFLHQKGGTASNTTASAQTPGASTTPGGSSQAAASSMVPVNDFYCGLPTKPSPFMQQTVARFEKYIGECRQWIEELEQLLLSDSDRNSLTFNSSVLQSFPKVLTNVHEFFVHVAAKVESIHQYIESMRTAYLADQRRRGDVGDPFLEANRREVARQEAAAKRVHPTLHLPAAPQPTTQVAGLFASSGAPGVSTAPQTSGAPVSSSAGTGFSLFGATPASTSSSSLFSTPATASGGLFSTSMASPQTSLFPSSSPAFPSASTASLFGGSAPASAPAGNSLFSTPFGSGSALGSGSSFGATNRAKPRSRTSRR